MVNKNITTRCIRPKHKNQCLVKRNNVLILKKKNLLFLSSDKCHLEL